MTYHLHSHLWHLIAPLLGDEIESEGGNGVHFHLPNLASYTSHSHKHTSQYLEQDSGPDVVNNMAIILSCLSRQLLSHPLQEPCSLGPIPPVVVKTRGKNVPLSLLYLQYSVEVVPFLLALVLHIELGQSLELVRF